MKIQAASAPLLIRSTPFRRPLKDEELKEVRGRMWRACDWVMVDELPAIGGSWQTESGEVSCTTS